ncbi:AEL295Cp [Eremothecium gossypii ATCC 10895]|uniref:AEL295Cp n=1 Tax=Eremothecium gossypii (strain ATCC 10895 / CBS 109.51 / FGSC 9923 / NRRL Y-1056) TaxID=284811 RepID=Q758P8_EREGS|nr:AEL295Cp [Eremothecium gossypii ATCC 10895]AAS52389.1 AEL295Cp [Eremothecium gossypii ATCC 10895]
MVLLNGVKYACERCIRGHRVTTCNHTDQPLMMIKPKGRPSTTCAHCKELKKNRNAHPSGVCTCGREEKRRQLRAAKEEARVRGRRCRCADREACVCHKTRRRRDDGEAGSASEQSSVDGHVMGSPHEPWDAASAASSLPPELSLESATPLGLEPLHAMKPITPLTRTHVGEVSIPLHEYVPAELDNSVQSANPLLNLNDRICLQDGAGREERLSFFADTSKARPNYSELKQRRLARAVDGTYAQSMRSASSTELASPAASASSASLLHTLNSSDSLSSYLTAGGSAYYSTHYQDMLHHSFSHLGSMPLAPSPQSSATATHLTGGDQPPTSQFLDSPDPAYRHPAYRHPASILHPPTGQAGDATAPAQCQVAPAMVQPVRQRSVSIHRNHRYEKFPTSNPSQPKDSPLGPVAVLAAHSFQDLSSVGQSTRQDAFAYSNHSVVANDRQPSLPRNPAPDSTFTAEFNQLLSESSNCLELDSIFSGNSVLWNGETLTSEARATLEGDVPSVSEDARDDSQANSAQNGPEVLSLADTEYADLDSLITNL